MSEHEDENLDLVFGKAVIKGAIIGLPVMLAFMLISILLITDETLTDSIATSLLSGTMLGVFGGGFLGAISAMKH